LYTGLYEWIYYIYVVFFGIYISFRLACGTFVSKHWKMLGLSCAMLLLTQGLVALLHSVETVRMLYPFITHLPLAALLSLAFSAKWTVSLTSVITSYAFCQLSRWIGLVIGLFALPPLWVCILHLGCSLLFLFLINRFLLDSLHTVLLRTSNAILHFGALPTVYYVYEYFMLFTKHRYASVLALSELLPTGLVLFFALFIAVYHREVEKRETAQSQLTLMEKELSNASHVIEALRRVQEETAICRHDMHHHLNVIHHLLTANQTEQAIKYTQEIQTGLEAISPARYCENEAANLILGSYAAKAESLKIPFVIRASLPTVLPMPDTELCALLSNALENAFHAVTALAPHADRTILFQGDIRQNTLLVKLSNPYAGELVFKDGLPLSPDGNIHYGCRSILAITQRRNGLCSFDAAHQKFTLRVAIPLSIQV